MFNSTHTFVGLALARTTGAEKWARYATATAVIASNLPDIDSVAGFWGTAAYIDHHRGITHSLIGVPFLSLLLAVAMYFFSGNFWKTYAIALIAMATHPALDYLNPYGLRPFLPWNGTWYYGDFVFIFDPYLDVLLLAGILVGTLAQRTRRVAAGLALAASVAYVGIRIDLHAVALSRLNGAQIPHVVKWAALPEMTNVLWWQGMFQTNELVATLPVYAGSSVRGTDSLSRKTSPSSEIVMAAARTRSASTLLRFARFPLTRVEKMPYGYRVKFFDFRFYRNETDTMLGAEVLLDDSLHVIKEDLSFLLRDTYD